MIDNDNSQRKAHRSNEATLAQLELAKKQGDAMQQALDAMKNEANVLLAKQDNEYSIHLALEEAEGHYVWLDAELVWRNPKEDNVHIEIVVADTIDGRFVPYLTVTVSIHEPHNPDPVLELDLPFMWHPWLYHYGSNFDIEEGEYDVYVWISALPTLRHDKKNGNRHTTPAKVQFENVMIKTGRKTS